MKWLLIFALLLPACSVKTHRVTIPVVTAADLVTTEMALAQGKVEMNPLPFAQSTSGRVAVSLLWTGLAIWWLEELHNAGHHGWAKAVEVLLIGVKGWPAVWNVKEMQE